MMNLMNVRMDVKFDPEDLIIDCTEAGQYCTADLSCKNCPFNCGEKNLAELISDYTQMLVSSDRKLSEKGGFEK